MQAVTGLGWHVEKIEADDGCWEVKDQGLPFVDMLKRYPANIVLGMGARYIDGVMSCTRVWILPRPGARLFLPPRAAW